MSSCLNARGILSPRSHAVRELNAAWAKLPAGKQPSCSLTVVSPTPYCTYTPLLPAVAVGKVDAKAVIQPIAEEMKCVP